MENRLTLIAEARRAIGHQPLTLCRADRGAEVGLARQAGLTLAAFRGVKRYDMVARLDAGHADANFTHNPCAFMPQNAWENTLAVKTIQRICIGMANPRCHDLDQNFACLWTF